MPKVRLTFLECLQDKQGYGSSDEYMTSRVLLEIAVDGADHGRYVAHLKQTVGSSFETGPIEVTRPVQEGDPKKAYRGPFDQSRFADEATKYFRGLVGSSGRGVGIGAGVKNLVMEGNTFGGSGNRKVVEFNVTGRGEAW